MQIHLLDQHHQYSFYEIQKNESFEICYQIPPHSHMFDHTPDCARIFIWKFVTNDPSYYNHFEELLVELHLLAQYFAKMLRFTVTCCVTKLKRTIATQLAKYLIALQGGGLKIRKLENRVESFT